MKDFLIKLKDIPSSGLDILVTDQSIWQTPILEFELPYKIIVPCESRVNIQVDNGCCILKGYIKGELIIPCDRCLEDSHIIINDFFKIIEEPQKEDVLDISFIIEKDGDVCLDLGGILWERLVLNVPSKILCSEDCKGLCPLCGVNLNRFQCNCRGSSQDPRLEILRKIKIY